MTTAPSPTRERFNQAQAFRQIAVSLVLNALVPFLIFTALEPQFPADSIMPLLAATIVPALVIAVGLIARRSVDAVAAVALGSLMITLIVTIAASDIRFALIARALQGTLTGVFFLLTVLVRRPLLGLIARQFVSVAPLSVRERFEAADRSESGRTFKILTLLWGVLIIARSFVNLWIAETLSASTYLLASPIIGVATTVLMVLFTIRFASRRFTRQALAAHATAQTTLTPAEPPQAQGRADLAGGLEGR